MCWSLSYDITIQSAARVPLEEASTSRSQSPMKMGKVAVLTGHKINKALEGYSVFATSKQLSSENLSTFPPTKLTPHLVSLTPENDRLHPEIELKKKEFTSAHLLPNRSLSGFEGFVIRHAG